MNPELVKLMRRRAAASNARATLELAKLEAAGNASPELLAQYAAARAEEIDAEKALRAFGRN